MADHTGSSYDDIANKYADTVEDKPIMVYFERPAFLSLLPSVKNMQVLDAGCGNGWYSAYLLAEGAKVTAFDFNKDFVKRTEERLQERARVFQANLAEPLTMLSDEAFDLIICPLVMHYIKDWLPVFKDFNRILKAGGHLIFSTHHPSTDLQLSKGDDYFATELIEDEWDVGKVTFYRRPLTTMTTDLRNAGFVIEDILEPQPLKTLEAIDADLYKRFNTNPLRLMFRVRKA